MAKLKKYTSFKALKTEDKPEDSTQNRDVLFSEFEAFVKKLQSEHAIKKKPKTENGKQLD